MHSTQRGVNRLNTTLKLTAEVKKNLSLADNQNVRKVTEKFEYNRLA